MRWTGSSKKAAYFQHIELAALLSEQLLSDGEQLRGHEVLKVLRGLGDGGAGGVVVPTVLNNPRDVPQELGQGGVLAPRQFLLHCLQVHGFLDNSVVLLVGFAIHWLFERGTVLGILDLFEKFLDDIEVLQPQGLQVGRVDPRVLVTVGALVLLDGSPLGLQDTDAAAVEPVGTLLTTNIEPGLVVRLSAETVRFRALLSCRTLVTHVLGHFLRHLGCNPNTGAVEPVRTDIATNVEPAITNIN